MNDRVDMDERDEAAARLEEIRRKRAEEFRPLEYAHADYRWDRTQEKFWDIVSYQLVGREVVDASIPEEAWRIPELPPGSRREPRPVKPSNDIKRVRDDLTVHNSTWHPGKPQIIENMLADESGFTPLKGVKLFNTYRSPQIGVRKGEPLLWIGLVKTLFPVEIEHEYFFNFCAHMIQRPHEKCNAGIVLSGSQGVGKDAILLPLKECVGFANAKNIGPDTLFSDFNEFVKSVMLVVDEVRSHKDDHRATAMYNKLKELCASPPNMLRMNLKKLQPVWVANLCRLFMTTNEVDGMFIPRDDRRMFIMHTDIQRIDAELDGLFESYWRWIDDDGAFDLWHWLSRRDLSGFDPKSEPPKTAKHQEIAKSWGFEEGSPITAAFAALINKEGELPGVLSGEELKVAVAKVLETASEEQEKMLKIAFSRRTINRTLDQAGYVKLLCRGTSNGLWRDKFNIDQKTFDVEATFYRLKNVGVGEAHDVAAQKLPEITERKKAEKIAQQKAALALP